MNSGSCKNVMNKIETKPKQSSKKISKVGDRSQGRPKGSLFDSYYTEVLGRMLLFSLYFST